MIFLLALCISVCVMKKATLIRSELLCEIKIYSLFTDQVNIKSGTGSQNVSITAIQKQRNSVGSKRYSTKKPRILKGMQMNIQISGLLLNLEDLQISGNLIFDRKIKEKSGNFGILSRIRQNFKA